MLRLVKNDMEMPINAETVDQALWAVPISGGLVRRTAEGEFVWYQLPGVISDLPAGHPDRYAVGSKVERRTRIHAANAAARKFVPTAEELKRYCFDAASEQRYLRTILDA